MIAIGVEGADQGEKEPSHHHVAPRMSLPHKPSHMSLQKRLDYTFILLQCSFIVVQCVHAVRVRDVKVLLRFCNSDTHDELYVDDEAEDSVSKLEGVVRNVYVCNFTRLSVSYQSTPRLYVPETNICEFARHCLVFGTLGKEKLIIIRDQPDYAHCSPTLIER
jgi:hypothetical protein